MKKLSGLVAVLLFLFMACKPPAETKSSAAGPAHNNASSLDRNGTYSGVLPCADCEGIRTTLLLNGNQTYVLRTSHGSNESSPNEQKGSFEWTRDGNAINLKGVDGKTAPTVYAVGENTLLPLDGEGKKITGAVADKYRLQKTLYDAALNRYWKLTELYGKPVPPPTGNSEAHLIFHPDFRVSGSGGCNRLTGLYRLQAGSRMALQIASTKMACPYRSTENQFLKVLGAIDNYTVTADTLQLYKARTAALARFVAVEMK